jgi:hypothetical protein
MDRWRSSPSGGSTVLEQGLWPPRSNGFCLLLLLPLPPPVDLMMRAHVPVQPGWGMASNHGWHTTGLDDPTKRRRGMMVPSTSKLAGQGKVTGGGGRSMALECGGAEGDGGGCAGAGAGQRWHRAPRRPRQRWRGSATVCNKATMNSISSLEGILPLFLIFSCGSLSRCSHRVVLIMC